MSIGNSNSKARVETVDFWISQASHFLHRYLANPEPGTLQSLLTLLAQYREAVEMKKVEPPRIF